MTLHPRSIVGTFARLRLLSVLALAVLVSALWVPGASALRVCSYNLLNYDNQNTVRDPAFRTVLSNLSGIDVLAVQEIQDATAVNNFRNNVLEVIEPGQWSAATFYDDPTQSFNQGLYYRTSAVSIVASGTLNTSPRDVSWYTFRPTGYTSTAADCTVFVLHLKAGSSSGDQSTRLVETQILRSYMNDLPAGSNLIVCGDFNIRSSSESAYQQMVGSQADNDGRVFDPINSPGTWYNNGSFSSIHTQSTRTGLLSPGDGGATGGMDDRFDQLLTSSALSDGNGLDQIAATYDAYGQDGNHFNLAISDAPTIPEGQVVADALERASDHLPVFMDFQVPAIVTADASIAFGTVIVGAVADQFLNVSNSAVVPADELDYTLVAPVGFTVPGGPFQDPAGGGGNQHNVSMITATAGNLSGDIVVSSNDVDTPSLLVPTTGTVLDHAVPSLASGSPVLADSADFGTHAEGFFSDQTVEAHNFGYTALQAALNVYDAQITGGGGRFSLVGGFSPGDVLGSPSSYTIHFDDGGATVAFDSTYTATLVFSTRDQQGLPGAADLSDLTVTLVATVEASTSGLGNGNEPLATVLRSNFPNPFLGSTRIQFDLAEDADARLQIFDVRGRLVRTLVDGHLPSGSYELSWAGYTESGREATPGVYFYILQTPALRETRRMTKLH